jgi:hypothetical protein
LCLTLLSVAFLIAMQGEAAGVENALAEGAKPTKKASKKSGKKGAAESAAAAPAANKEGSEGGDKDKAGTSSGAADKEEAPAAVKKDRQKPHKVDGVKGYRQHKEIAVNWLWSWEGTIGSRVCVGGCGAGQTVPCVAPQYIILSLFSCNCCQRAATALCHCLGRGYTAADGAVNLHVMQTGHCILVVHVACLPAEDVHFLGGVLPAQGLMRAHPVQGGQGGGTGAAPGAGGGAG